MDALLQDLIEALREELKQYGETLALLDPEPEVGVQRRRPDPIQSIAAVSAQAEAICAARRECEQRRRHLARNLGLDQAIGLPKLLPHLPAAYRPLVQALLEENRELQIRVQRRARQTHLLHNRAVELMRRFIHALFPEASTATEAAAEPGPTGSLSQSP